MKRYGHEDSMPDDNMKMEQRIRCAERKGDRYRAQTIKLDKVLSLSPTGPLPELEWPAMTMGSRQ